MFDFLENKCTRTIREYLRSLDLDPHRRCESIPQCIHAIQDWVRVRDRHPAKDTTGVSKEGLKAFGAAIADGRTDGTFGAASSGLESTSGSADDGAKKATIAPGEGQIVPYDPSAAPNAAAGGLSAGDSNEGRSFLSLFTFKAERGSRFQDNRDTC